MSKSKIFAFLLIFLSFSAIFSFYNFDSASAYTGTITYDSGTNTITCVGGSSSVPITFEDIYQADSSGSWNVFIKYSSNLFLMNCTLIIGDSTNLTYFKDYNKAIQIIYNYNAYGNQITVKNNTVFQLGNLRDETSKTTDNGCEIINTLDGSHIIYGESGAIINLYSTVLRGSYSTGKVNNVITGQFATYNIYNCIFDGVGIQSSIYLNIYNINIFRVKQSALQSVDGNFDTINIGYCDKIAIFNNRNATIYNLRGNVISEHKFFLDGYCWINIIDSNLDSWSISFNNAVSRLFRQYTFNLNVLNGDITDFVQNANVTLYKDGSKIYSALTNSSGMIPTQTLTYGYYQLATGNNIQNATSPYYLVITHPDWQTYVSRFYITEPLRLTISMQEPTYTGYTEAEKSDYTTIILFAISLILCIIGLALTVPLLPLISLTISVINIIFLSEPTIFNILLIALNVTFTLIALLRAKTKNN